MTSPSPSTGLVRRAPATLDLTPGGSHERGQVVQALNSYRIGAVTEAQVLAFVTAGFNKALLILNHTKTAAATDLNTNKEACHEIVFFLMERFGYLHLDEIPIVFRKGSFGDFRQPGDVLFLSVSNVQQWFKAYRAGLRAEALRAIGKFQPHPLLRQADGPCCHFPDDHPLWLYTAGAKLVALAERLLEPGVVYDRSTFDLPLYNLCKRLGLFARVWSAEDYADVLNEEAQRIFDAGCPTAGGLVASWDEKGAWKTFTEGYQREELPADNRHTRRVMDACRERLLREYLTEHALADDNFAVTVRAAVGSYLRENPFIPPTGVELP